jgi:hypothetical protein
MRDGIMSKTVNKLRTVNKNKRVSGFADGFLSPFLFFTLGPVHFSYRRYDTVKVAWRGVGSEISKATQSESKRIGKATFRKEVRIAFH